MSDLQNIQVSKITRAFDEVPELMQKAGKRAFQTYGHQFIRFFTRERLTGRPGLMRRTGSLARSFNTNVLESEGALTLIVWTASKYARLQEYGGDIEPKKTKYLAIPTGAALTKAGASRFASPRNVVGLRFMQKAGGKPFLGKVEGGSVRAYFLLRKKVSIPPRLALNKTWIDESPLIPKILTEVAESVLSTRFPRVK